MNNLPYSKNKIDHKLKKLKIQKVPVQSVIYSERVIQQD